MDEEEKTSEEIAAMINDITSCHCDLGYEPQHEENGCDKRIEEIKKLKWLPADKAISLEMHKAIAKENFEWRKELIDLKNRSIPREEHEKEMDTLSKSYQDFKSKSIFIEDVKKVINQTLRCPDCKTKDKPKCIKVIPFLRRLNLLKRNKEEGL